MRFLADANVLSEATKARRSPRATAWLREHRADIVIDAIVLAEIWRGIDAMTAGRKKEELKNWFESVPRSERCLPWTHETAIVWGELFNRLKHAGFAVGLMDTMIAATAKVHGLTVATRNVNDLTRCCVPVVNPFE